MQLKSGKMASCHFVDLPMSLFTHSAHRAIGNAEMVNIPPQGQEQVPNFLPVPGKDNCEAETAHQLLFP